MSLRGLLRGMSRRRAAPGGAPRSERAENGPNGQHAGVVVLHPEAARRALQGWWVQSVPSGRRGRPQLSRWRPGLAQASPRPSSRAARSSRQVEPPGCPCGLLSQTRHPAAPRRVKAGQGPRGRVRRQSHLVPDGQVSTSVRPGARVGSVRALSVARLGPSGGVGKGEGDVVGPRPRPNRTASKHAVQQRPAAQRSGHSVKCYFGVHDHDRSVSVPPPAAVVARVPARKGTGRRFAAPQPSRESFF